MPLGAVLLAARRLPDVIKDCPAGSNNLLPMRNEEQKIQIALGFDTCGQKQPDYCRAYGISTRTVRAWRQRYVERGARNFSPALIEAVAEEVIKRRGHGLEEPVAANTPKGSVQAANGASSQPERKRETAPLVQATDAVARSPTLPPSPLPQVPVGTARPKRYNFDLD